MAVAQPLYQPDEYGALADDAWITRGDLAQIAGVVDNTVRLWSQTQPQFPAEHRVKNVRVMRFGDAMDWLCATGRVECRHNDVGIDELADQLGVSPYTVESWRRLEGFPEPVRRTTERSPRFDVAAVRAWRQARPDRRRTQVA